MHASDVNFPKLEVYIPAAKMDKDSKSRVKVVWDYLVSQGKLFPFPTDKIESQHIAVLKSSDSVCKKFRNVFSMILGSLPGSITRKETELHMKQTLKGLKSLQNVMSSSIHHAKSRQMTLPVVKDKSAQIRVQKPKQKRKKRTSAAVSVSSSSSSSQPRKRRKIRKKKVLKKTGKEEAISSSDDVSDSDSAYTEESTADDSANIINKVDPVYIYSDEAVDIGSDDAVVDIKATSKDVRKKISDKKVASKVNKVIKEIFCCGKCKKAITGKDIHSVVYCYSCRCFFHGNIADCAYQASTISAADFSIVDDICKNFTEVARKMIEKKMGCICFLCEQVFDDNDSIRTCCKCDVSYHSTCLEDS